MMSVTSPVEAAGSEPQVAYLEPELEPLMSASIDELRILASMAGAVLPQVCDAELDGEARTSSDMAAVRSLLARGWVQSDGADRSAGATPAVAAALGALLAPDVLVELEVLAEDELRRELLVLGPTGNRWLTERLLGVWDVAVAPADPMSRIHALATAPGDPSDPVLDDPDIGDPDVVDPDLEERDPDDPKPDSDESEASASGAPSAAVTEVDVEAELANGGREVVLRLARRLGDEEYEAHELHWVIGPSGQWVVEATNSDDEQSGDDVAVPASRDELDATLVDFLATIADVLARSSSAVSSGSTGPAGDR